MKYDFETLVSRKGTGAVKWDIMYSAKSDVAEGTVPFSIADMEFKNAPEIIEGLKSYLDTAILGYTAPTDAYCSAVIDWHTKRHGFTPEKEQLLTSPGVVPAFINAAGALTDEGDAIVFMTPAYPPFWSAATKNRLTAIECPLVLTDGDYTVDFDLFESIVSRPEVKVFLLCNPHNPVGRVWTKDELRRMLELCLENGVYVISDEIHSDLIMPGADHVSVGTLGDRYIPFTVICTAPSKTFNLAGMQSSNVIVRDASLRKRLTDAGMNVTLSALGYEACRLAYAHGEEWLEELITVLDGNFRYMYDYIEANMPYIKPTRTEGTYLAWLDCRALGLDPKALEALHVKHDLFLDEGYIFGREGEGFVRINVACPRAVLADALDRIKTAYDEIMPK